MLKQVLNNVNHRATLTSPPNPSQKGGSGKVVPWQNTGGTTLEVVHYKLTKQQLDSQNNISNVYF